MKTILVLLFLCLGCLPLAHAQERPNIVLIIADDIATYDLGAYGNRTVQSPRLDRLAREGMRFDRAFVTIASCSPSRASIITGRYPHNTDAEQLHWPLPAAQTSFVELLRDAGYWTAAAGKWHLGDPAKQRFHEVREADESGYQIPVGGTGSFVETMAEEARSGSDQWVPILKNRPRDQPFFLWLGSLDAHRPYSKGVIPAPHQPADVFVPPFMVDDPAVREDLALYYDEITRFDRYVGLVLDELEAQGVANNTLIIVMSDNGQPFVRAKTTLYDSGIKTPFLLRWPAGIKAGTVSQSVISAVDIAPTLLELAGVAVPATVQGRSFAPILKNPAASIRQHAFAEKHWHDYDDAVRAVTTGRFKYIRNYDTARPGTPSADGVRSPAYQVALALRGSGRLTPAQASIFHVPRPAEELYDCEADPFETVNLADRPEYADTLAGLRQALLDWQRETDDRISVKRPPDEFDRETGLPTAARIRPRPTKAEMIARGLLDR